VTKYGAKRCTSPAWPGVEFHSMAERDRADFLLGLQLAGHISELELHPAFVLSKKPSCKVTFDARYKLNGWLTVEDTKGAVARDFRVRALWFRQLNPGIKVLVVKRDPGCPSGWLAKEVK
jgi:hypothetical protein